MIAVSTHHDGRNILAKKNGINCCWLCFFHPGNTQYITPYNTQTQKSGCFQPTVHAPRESTLRILASRGRNLWQPIRHFYSEEEPTETENASSTFASDTVLIRGVHPVCESMPPLHRERCLDPPSVVSARCEVVLVLQGEKYAVTLFTR